MINALNFALGIVSILAAAVTAVFAYNIYRHNRLSKPWLAVILAFALMIVRRIVGFSLDLDLYADMKDLISLTENVLMVASSLLFIWGFWAMRKNFQRFDIVEKRSKENIAEFNNRKKK